jgi:hypothetical protein
MFVTVVLRARGPTPADAVIASQHHLERLSPPRHGFALLLVCSYDVGCLAALIDRSDVRRRDRQAAALRHELPTREAMLRHCKKTRFFQHFMALSSARTRHERSIFQKLEQEYLASVDSPESELVFLKATDPIVRGMLAVVAPEPDAPSLDELLLRREQRYTALVTHTSPKAFPLVDRPGLSLNDCWVHDLGGEGPEHFVLASVHI